MTPINSSDTAWLIVADYNQENGKYHEELREDVLNPEVNLWHFEHNTYHDLIEVGSLFIIGECVGGSEEIYAEVGDIDGDVGSGIDGSVPRRVGGYMA